jgi:hypothetical protein
MFENFFMDRGLFYLFGSVSADVESWLYKQQITQAMPQSRVRQHNALVAQPTSFDQRPPSPDPVSAVQAAAPAPQPAEPRSGSVAASPSSAVPVVGPGSKKRGRGRIYTSGAARQKAYRARRKLRKQN